MHGCDEHVCDVRCQVPSAAGNIDPSSDFDGFAPLMGP